MGIYNSLHRLSDVDASDFRDYIKKLESFGNDILPDWWNAERTREVLFLVKDEKLWLYLGKAVTSSEVVSHYNEKALDDALRLIGDRIYGTSVVPVEVARSDVS
jgi:hypothetical protein